jgi:uncharacterized protein (TIGR02270 family)
LLAALAGQAPDHDALVLAADRPELRRDAIWALGFAGRRAGADLCVDLVCQDLEPRLAAEAFCAITGCDLQAEPGLAAPPSGEGEDAPAITNEDLAPPAPDRLLPLPDAAGLTRWWQAARRGFSAEVRYLRGSPIDTTALQSELERGSMRRRPPIALELAIRTQGRYDVATAAFSWEQRRQLAAFSALPVPVRRAAEQWSPS